MIWEVLDTRTRTCLISSFRWIPRAIAEMSQVTPRSLPGHFHVGDGSCVRSKGCMSRLQQSFRTLINAASAPALVGGRRSTASLRQSWHTFPKDIVKHRDVGPQPVKGSHHESMIYDMLRERHAAQWKSSRADTTVSVLWAECGRLMMSGTRHSLRCSTCRAMID